MLTSWLVSLAAVVAAGDSTARPDSVPLVVREIVVQVQSVNPGIAALQARIKAAEARRAAAGGAPPVMLSGEVEEMPGVALTRAGSVRMGVQRQLGLGSQRHAAQALADADVTQARAVLGASVLAVTGQVMALVEGIAGKTMIAERLSAEARLLDEIGQSLTQRFSVGDARYVDVLRLRTERLRVMNQHADATSAARIARVVLLGLVSADTMVARRVTVLLDQFITTRNGLAFPELPSVEASMIQSLAIRVADTERTRSMARAALGTALRKPQLTAGFGLQRFGDADAGQNQRKYGLTLGGSLTLPFSARGANQRAAYADAAHVSVADAMATATRADIRAQLLVAREQYAAARARMDAYDMTLLRGAREERESALAAYRAGTMTLLELLDFERALVHAETGRIDARIGAMQAYAKFTAIVAAPTPSAVLLGDDHEDSFDSEN